MKGDPRVFPEFTRHVAVQNFTPAARSEGEGPLKKSRQATLGGAPSQSRPAEQAGRDPRSRGASYRLSYTFNIYIYIITFVFMWPRSENCIRPFCGIAFNNVQENDSSYG